MSVLYSPFREVPPSPWNDCQDPVAGPWALPHIRLGVELSAERSADDHLQ
jgi:hypothetical protein